MSFEFPYLLFLLLPLAGLLYLLWRRREPAFVFPWLKPFRCGGRKKFDLRKFFPFLCYALAGIALVFALSRPRGGREVLRTDTAGIDILLVLDVSGSMLSYDAQPDEIASGMALNRLAVAKKEIASFIRRRPDDRIGIIQFAEGPDLVCPPTLDHAYLLSVLASLKPEPEMLGSRTGIAAPLVAAADSLKTSENAVIVLFTDGRDNVAMPLTPEAAAEHAANQKFRIYTVGIGSRQAYAIAAGLFGRSSLYPAESDFDEDLLKKIAALSGGKYYAAADAEGMNAAMREINQIEKTADEEKVIVYTKEYYPALALAAIGFLLAGIALQRVFLRKLP